MDTQEHKQASKSQMLVKRLQAVADVEERAQRFGVISGVIVTLAAMPLVLRLLSYIGIDAWSAAGVSLISAIVAVTAFVSIRWVAKSFVRDEKIRLLSELKQPAE